MMPTNVAYNYILSELAHIGINFDDSNGIHYSIDNHKSDHVSLKQSIKSTELLKAVDLYINKLIETGASYNETEPVRVKLKYMLKVYEAQAFDNMHVLAQNFGSSDINVEGITENILCNAKENPEEYSRQMDVNGEVLIARFALYQFWYSEFLDFINFVCDMLSEGMRRAYVTMSDIELAENRLSEYTYQRRVNSEFSIRLTLESDSERDEMVMFLDKETLPNGTIIRRRNDEDMKRHYREAAEGKNLPTFALVELVNKDDVVVASHSWGANASRCEGGRYAIDDRRELIREAVKTFRSELKAQNAESAWKELNSRVA